MSDFTAIDPLVAARAIHFAATIVTAGTVIFVVLVPGGDGDWNDARAGAALRRRLAGMAWIGLALAVISGVVWLVYTSASMSGQPPADVFSGGILLTVLTQTEFGRDWLVRGALVFILAALFTLLFRGKRSKSSAARRAIDGAALISVAALAGSLAFAGHAIGSQGVEGMLHPSADVLHLIAAAAWVGGLAPLTILLAITEADAAGLAAAGTATLRFSIIGVISVATLLITGIVNTWYLAGSIAALTQTDYGRLLLIKIALFLVMVAIAAINRQRLTPQLVDVANGPGARQARRALRRNASVETALGAAVIAIVALLGTLPPGSHAHHHTSDQAIPADATFQHIHGEDGMADVMIEPGRIGTAHATVRLWNDNLDPLAARQVILTLTAPSAGTSPLTRPAVQNSDGAWVVRDLRLGTAGNWTVEIDATLADGKPLKLAAPIVVAPR